MISRSIDQLAEFVKTRQVSFILGAVKLRLVRLRREDLHFPRLLAISAAVDLSTVLDWRSYGRSGGGIPAKAIMNKLLEFRWRRAPVYPLTNPHPRRNLRSLSEV